MFCFFFSGGTERDQKVAEISNHTFTKEVDCLVSSYQILPLSRKINYLFSTLYNGLSSYTILLFISVVVLSTPWKHITDNMVGVPFFLGRYQQE